MFEREAEKYGKEKCAIQKNGLCTFVDSERTSKIWKDGAEFGYKKAKEDADKMKSRFLELCHLKDMRIEKLEKANEWHNINDIEPSKKQFGKQLLIKIESVIGDTDYDYLVYKYKGESISDVAGVLAWKEIE